jgi:hypothetical protein
VRRRTTEAAEPRPLIINGWNIFAHPLFLDQLEELAQKVEALKKRDSKGWMKKNAAKRLAAVTKVAFELIPQDPAHPQFRQGDTLGGGWPRWQRRRSRSRWRRTASLGSRLPQPGNRWPRLPLLDWRGPGEETVVVMRAASPAQHSVDHRTELPLMGRNEGPVTMAGTSGHDAEICGHIGPKYAAS